MPKTASSLRPRPYFIGKFHSTVLSYLLFRDDNMLLFEPLKRRNELSWGCHLVDLFAWLLACVSSIDRLPSINVLAQRTVHPWVLPEADTLVPYVLGDAAD